MADTMLRRLCRFPWHVPARLESLGVAVGLAAVTPSGGTAPAGVCRHGQLLVAFDGELYSPRLAIADIDVAQHFAEHLRHDGPSFLDAAHGSFACAVWDEQSSRLSIATDRYGTRALYWTKTSDRFLFASELSALLLVDGVSKKRDESGLAQFLCFGQYLGDSTLYEAIRLVPPGSWLTFDAANDSVTVTPYLTDTPMQPPSSDDAWTALVDDRTVHAIERACEGAGELGLSLSGGLDARTILGLAPAGTRLTCVSLGIPGSIDHAAASQLSAMAGQPHHQLMLSGDFLGRFEQLLREVIDLTDGHYLDQGIVLTTLPIYRELGIQTLLRGHAGELMHMNKAYAFSVDAEALQLRSTAELIDWLWRHLTDYMIGAADASLFSNGFAGRMRDMARVALERQVSQWEHVLPAPQRIWRLFVAERLRRETASSLHLFRNYVETRVPFLDPALVNVLLEAPVHLKVSDGLQAYLLGRHRPAFCDVVNANTGAPLSAGPWQLRLGQFRMKLFAKLGVAGYQPYERLGLWLARDLKPLVHRLLLSESFLSRGVFDAAGIKRLLDQHESRRRNHTYLIMALMIFELSQGAEVER